MSGATNFRKSIHVLAERSRKKRKQITKNIARPATDEPTRECALFSGSRATSVEHVARRRLTRRRLTHCGGVALGLRANGILRYSVSGVGFHQADIGGIDGTADGGVVAEICRADCDA
jgi:hypothetical protein